IAATSDPQLLAEAADTKRLGIVREDAYNLLVTLAHMTAKAAEISELLDRPYITRRTVMGYSIEDFDKSLSVALDYAAEIQRWAAHGLLMGERLKRKRP